MQRATVISRLVLLAACVANLYGQTSSVQTPEILTARERMLLERIDALEARLSALEAHVGGTAASQQGAANSAQAVVVSSPEAVNKYVKDTSVNVYLDGYYMWNANRPAGRVNLLRAYDGTANSFSINQAGLVVERAADRAANKSVGYRLDLMYGQATETLQGSPYNEARPEVYRNVFQAYGTWVAPVRKGLTVDFGKWASALGPEGNYTKDQINYSRGYFFNFLPFYHMGLRATYPVNETLTLSYWLVNGANQTEDFNACKSQLAQAVIAPRKNITWTLNYYNGREHRDDIRPVPRGRFHVLDTYAFWKVSEKLTLGGELDSVVSRVETGSPPQRVTGGATYFRYQLSPKLWFGQRYTRLVDHAGLFSGIRQSLNETTATLGYRPLDGFEIRIEYRRDSSDRRFFLTRTRGVLSPDQDTFTFGLLWWFGGKSGSW